MRDFLTMIPWGESSKKPKTSPNHNNLILQKLQVESKGINEVAYTESTETRHTCR